MKPYKTGLICFSFFVLSNIFFSCKDEYVPIYESFLIKVDSIQVTGNIKMNESFDIGFYGTVGTNGCYRFSQFKTEKQEKNLNIEVWGEYNRSSEVCPTVMVYLDNKKLNCVLNEKGNYTIKVKQPDGSYWGQLITVE